MNRYLIEITSEQPPRLAIGDNVAGGQVIGIKSNDPDVVSVTWLASRTGLSKSTILDKLAGIAQGTNGKKIYPRLQALQMLKDNKAKTGRPRKN